MRPKHRPYTVRGIRRVPCAKCGRPSRFGWTTCSLTDGWVGLCAEHDVELNALALRFVFGDTREADIAAYAEKVAQSG